MKKSWDLDEDHGLKADFQLTEHPDSLMPASKWDHFETIAANFEKSFGCNHNSQLSLFNDRAMPKIEGLRHGGDKQYIVESDSDVRPCAIIESKVAQVHNKSGTIRK